MQPRAEQQVHHQQTLKLMGILGGRVEILKINEDADNLIKQRNFFVSYDGDRPTIGLRR